jgi:response regulator of citrate/malate metabolism
MTAAPNMREIIAARAAGVNNYVCKPFTAEVLKGKIDWSFAQTASGLSKS